MRFASPIDHQLRRYWAGACMAALTACAATGAPAQAAAAARGPSSTQSSRTAQQQAVLNLEQRILQARVDGDPSVSKAELADEATYMHSTGWMQTKDEVLKMVAENPWAGWKESEVEVHLYGEMAVTHTLLAVLLGDKRTETVRTTGVYVKQSGKWRQVSWQSSEGKYVNAPSGAGK